MEIPLHIKKAINHYKPIEIDSLTFYPITVDEYEAFLIAKAGIEIMQQALPIHLVSMPLLSALYKLDFEKSIEEGKATGIFSQCLLFLALALRLGYGEDLDERLRRFQIAVDTKDASRLKSVIFKDEKTGLHGEITPIQFARYRPILAAQNGIKLADDDVNPELVKADKEIQAINAPKLEASLEDLISSVAALSGVDEETVFDWPILKMERRRAAISRAVDYVVCGVIAGSGATWKGGNPVPSLWFNRVQTGLGALREMGEKDKGAAAQGAQAADPTKIEIENKE